MVQTQQGPPFTLDGETVSLVANIAEQMGRLSAQPEFATDLCLRRINRIRTVAASLVIEGNTLTVEQITAMLDGKTVLAPPRELQEARNALAAYEQLPQWNSHNESDLLAARRTMMLGLLGLLGLLDHPGTYRSGGVGVLAGGEVIHMAPQADRVPQLMAQLFSWLRTTQEHPLIASSIFHYEFEFIHPFSDGNGRMGRLWQSLLLLHWNPAFAWLPIESLIHQHQAGYYRALQESTQAADCAPFIRFMLGCIHNALTSAKTTGKTTGKTPDSLLALLSENPLHLGRLAKEKPFNHKVEINAALRQRRVSFATHSPLLFLAFY